MAATLTTHTDGADLEFGAAGVITALILQNVECKRTGKTAEATDEDGDEIAVAIHGGRVARLTGDFLYEGANAGDIGTTLSVTDMDPDISTFYIFEFGLKRNHEGFATGDFQAIGLVAS